jgi:hypothetical protein
VTCRFTSSCRCTRSDSSESTLYACIRLRLTANYQCYHCWFRTDKTVHCAASYEHNASVDQDSSQQLITVLCADMLATRCTKRILLTVCCFSSCCMLYYCRCLQILCVNSQAAFSAMDAAARSALYKPQIAEVSAVLRMLIFSDSTLMCHTGFTYTTHANL